MKQNKIYSLLGLATKAGSAAGGEFMTEKMIKSRRASLVIVGDDASDNTKKMFRNMCEFYEVPIYFYGTKEGIGHAVGKKFRASIAVTDQGFAKSLMKHLDLECGRKMEVIE